jgi:hypothetical protein
MPLTSKLDLLAKLSPPLDGAMAAKLVDEFISLERRYILQDWEPAELDAGQFSEILGRILYHQDSGNLDPYRDFAKCAEFINNSGVSHNLSGGTAKMLFMVLTVTHKFRSKRGAVHISPDYQANHMDARYMIEAVRWAMVETTRVFSNSSRDEAAKMIKELLRFDVPAVGKFDDIVLVQRTDLRAEEEILILLHYAGVRGFTRKELGKHAKASAPSVTRSLDSLTAPQCREVLQLANGCFVLTDLGHKRIREEMASKLLLE